jgi:RND superfamily putative drug exporter
VLFAGMTVCIAVLGLTFAGVPYISTLGMAAALFVLVMVAAALTLLPAMLGFAGDRVRSRRSRKAGQDSDGAMWARWGREVAKRPWPCLVVSLALLLALASPVLSMRLGFTDDGNDPTSFTQRRAYDLISESFGAGANGPLLLTVALPTDSAQKAEALTAGQALLARIKAAPGVAEVTPALPNPQQDAAVALVQSKYAPNSDATQRLVRTLRSDVIPQAVKGTPLAGRIDVGGQTAELIDLTDRIDERLLICISAVVAAAFVLLMLVFRSIFVPLKAAVMNLLSIGAAYGVVVAVFQWGWGKSLIGLQSTVPIEAFVPLMMFAILFGLSMDYEVFLLSRIREEYLRTGDNREAVASGLGQTARVITSAALIMISVFLSFVASPQPTVKMIGLGLAAAVFVDATLVRLILVPATMELLGKANWWFPPALEKLLPHIDVDRPDPVPAPVPEVSGEEPEPEPALT